MVDNRFDPKPMMLQGNLVRLEPLTLDHAPGLLNIAQDESIWQFFAMDAPKRLDEAEQWIKGRLSDQEAGQRLPFAVISLANGEFAGSTGYSEINKTNRTIAIASWYGVKYQRTGVNTECKYMLLKYAFEEFLGDLQRDIVILWISYYFWKISLVIHKSNSWNSRIPYNS